MALDDIMERKVSVLINLRGYRLLARKVGKRGIYLTVKDRSGRKITIYAVPSGGTVGADYVEQLKRRMKSDNSEYGIMITNGNYTDRAKTEAQKSGIELIPSNFPTFNIFEHVLVPKHEILTPEEREEVLKKYRVKPYQIPHIKASDPIVRVIGAKPGDILRIIRKSPTAGEYISYRYVVED